MGVTGLMSWMQSCWGTLATSIELSGKIVIVDCTGLAFALLKPGGVGRFLQDAHHATATGASAKRQRPADDEEETHSTHHSSVWGDSVGTAAGVSYSALFRKAQHFAEALRACRVEAVFVMDGVPGPGKSQTHLRRAAQAGNAAGEAAKLLAGMETDRAAIASLHQGAGGLRPAMIDDVVAVAVEACGFRVVRAAEEADDVILSLCDRKGAVAVLSNDSDFVVASSSPGLVPLSSLTLSIAEPGSADADALPPTGTAPSPRVLCTGSIFCRRRLAAVLRLPPRALAGMAGLAGNDLIDGGDFVHGAVFDALSLRPAHPAPAAAEGAIDETLRQWPTALTAWLRGNGAASGSLLSPAAATGESGPASPSQPSLRGRGGKGRAVKRRKRRSVSAAAAASGSGVDLRGGRFHRHDVLEAVCALLRRVWVADALTAGASAALASAADSPAKLDRANCSAVVASLMGTIRRVGRARDRRDVVPGSGDAAPVDGSDRALRCWLEHEASSGAQVVATRLYCSLLHAVREYNTPVDGESVLKSHGGGLTRSSLCLRERLQYRWPVMVRLPGVSPAPWLCRTVRRAAFACVASGPKGGVPRELAGLEQTVLSLRARGSDEAALRVAAALWGQWRAGEAAWLRPAGRLALLAGASALLHGALAASDAGSAGAGEEGSWLIEPVDPRRATSESLRNGFTCQAAAPASASAPASPVAGAASHGELPRTLATHERLPRGLAARIRDAAVSASVESLAVADEGGAASVSEASSGRAAAVARATELLQRMVHSLHTAVRGGTAAVVTAMDEEPSEDDGVEQRAVGDLLELAHAHAALACAVEAVAAVLQLGAGREQFGSHSCAPVSPSVIVESLVSFA